MVHVFHYFWFFALTSSDPFIFGTALRIHSRNFQITPSALFWYLNGFALVNCLLINTSPVICRPRKALFTKRLCCPTDMYSSSEIINMKNTNNGTRFSLIMLSGPHRAHSSLKLLQIPATTVKGSWSTHRYFVVPNESVLTCPHSSTVPS